MVLVGLSAVLQTRIERMSKQRIIEVKGPRGLNAALRKVYESEEFTKGYVEALALAFIASAQCRPQDVEIVMATDGAVTRVWVQTKGARPYGALEAEADKVPGLVKKLMAADERVRALEKTLEDLQGAEDGEEIPGEEYPDPEDD
jgi:hypothetical protein